MKKLGELKTDTNRKILLMGDAGTGKTVFACAFPTPLFVADFDNKVSSAAAFFAKDAKRLAGIDYETYVASNAEDRPFARYYTKLTELRKLATQGKLAYKTVVLDSLSTYSDAMMREVMYQNVGAKRAGPTGIAAPALQDYMLHANHFKNVLVELLSLPCNVIVTAHIALNKDETTGEIFREPFLPGKLARQLPIWFEEVYRTFAQTKDGRTTYFAQTQSGQGYQCRSQIVGLPNPVELDYATYQKFAG